MFGSSGLHVSDGRPVIERFTRCAEPDHGLRRWIKSIVRTGQIAGMVSPHSCDIASGHYATPAGVACEVREHSWSSPISQEAGHYNHYVVKSKQEYTRKQDRGQATEAPDAPDKYTKYDDMFFALHDRNEVEDRGAVDRLEAVQREIDRLVLVDA